MTFFGKLFGSDEILKKTAKGLYNGIDAAFFTDEEKSKYFLSLLQAYEPYKLAQRLLALTVGIPYVSIWILCAVLLVVNCFTQTNLSESIKELAKLNNETLGLPFSLILGFYFGGGAVEGVLRVKRGK